MGCVLLAVLTTFVLIILCKKELVPLLININASEKSDEIIEINPPTLHEIIVQEEDPSFRIAKDLAKRNSSFVKYLNAIDSTEQTRFTKKWRSVDFYLQYNGKPSVDEPFIGEDVENIELSHG